MLIGIVSFSGQYNHLIYRRIRELGVNAELFKPTLSVSEVFNLYDGLILGGGPQNIPEDLSNLGYVIDYVLNSTKPLLGICLGHQIISYVFGGVIGDGREFGITRIYIDDEDDILRGVGREINVWESHNKAVVKEPSGFRVLARSDKVRIQALAHSKKPLYTLQFHPEVTHTDKGGLIFKNFIDLCRR